MGSAATPVTMPLWLRSSVWYRWLGMSTTPTVPLSVPMHTRSPSRAMPTEVTGASCSAWGKGGAAQNDRGHLGFVHGLRNRGEARVVGEGGIRAVRRWV